MLARALTSEAIAEILEAVPDAWLSHDGSTLAPAEVRAAYGRYLGDRLVAPRPFLEEAARVG